MIKFCKKCKKNVKHKLVKDNRVKNNYYSCSICLKNYTKKYRKKYWARYLAQKANARKRDKSEKMTEQIILDKYYDQQCRCALSGIPFNMNETLFRPSLDRIDSNKGYTKDNIQVVAFIVNKMKQNLHEYLFIEMCFNISNNFRNITKGGTCGD